MPLIKRHSFLILSILLLIGGYAFLRSNEAVAPTETTPSPSKDQTLSDKALVDYAQSDFDQAKMMGQDIILGQHNKTPVRVTFPCSDVCPQATIRIIRYDVEPTQCEAVGGELKSILVPIAIAVMPQEFCFPKPIVESGGYEFVKK